MRLKDLVLAILSCQLFAASVVYADGCDLCGSGDGGYGLGLGGGVSRVSGDFMLAKHLTDVSIGMDIEHANSFFVWRAITDKDNKASNLQMMIGGGARYAKIGVGFVFETIDAPPAVPTGFLAAPDPTRETSIDVKTYPVYVRLHPWIGDNFIVTLDGYYGFGSTGTMKVPLYFLPGGDIETQPQRAGGLRGSDAKLQWWPWGHKGASFRLEVAQDEGRMDRAQTKFSRDPLGIFGTVNIPQIQFRTRQTLLSVLMPL